MTDDGFRDRLDPTKRSADLRSGSSKPVATTAADASATPEVDDPAFSILSADRQHKVMVEFRFKNGNAKGMAYSYLVSLDFDPSKGITMDFAGYEVRIGGRNLGPLFSGLVTQRVAVVSETDDLQAEARGEQDETVVTQIEVERQG